MNDLEQIKILLTKQIALYKEYTAKEKLGEVDSSYVYDSACDWFNNLLTRGDYLKLLEILSR